MSTRLGPAIIIVIVMIQALVAAGVANAPSHSFSGCVLRACVRACVRVCVCMQASDAENFDIGSEIMTNIVLEEVSGSLTCVY